MTDQNQSGDVRHVHLDVLGGIAGDMFIAAIIDARPDLAAGTIDAIRAAGVPADWIVTAEPTGDSGLVGTRMRVEAPQAAPDKGGQHYEYAAILSALSEAPLHPEVKSRAMGIMHLIAAAEAEVHGVDIDGLVLHELGAVDSIADVVGAAFLIEELSAASWSTGPLPLGGGFIETDHGRLPIPAPATQLLLRGYVVVDDGVSGERITPTGAAILRHLDPSFGLPMGSFVSAETGQGFGTRTLPGMANMLRTRFYETREVAIDEQVGVIEFLVDDQTPEDLAIGLTALRDLPEVLDVLQSPVVTKKGRMGHAIQVITGPNSMDQAAATVFEQTTTIGLRYRLEHRKVLSRLEETGLNEVAVKVVTRPDGRPSAKADMDDIHCNAHGHLERERLRRRVESAALHADEHE